MCSPFFSKCASCFSCYKSEKLKKYVELEEYQKIESEPVGFSIGMPEFHHVPVDKIFQIPHHGKGFTGTHWPHQRVTTPDLTTENSAVKPTARNYGSTQAKPLHRGSYGGTPSAKLQPADVGHRSRSHSGGFISGGKGLQLRTLVEDEPESEEGAMVEDKWSRHESSTSAMDDSAHKPSYAAIDHHGSLTNTANGLPHKSSSYAAVESSKVLPLSHRTNTVVDKLSKQEQDLSSMETLEGDEGISESRSMIERSLMYPQDVKYSNLTFSPSLDLQKVQAVTPPPSRPESATSWVVGASSDEEEDADSQPTLQFSLYYDIQRRTLTVHLQRAYNLPVKDIFMGSSDPFVVMFLLPSRDEILQSKIVEKELNPVFDQVFEFRAILSQELYSQVLVMQVYDHDKFASNDLIGSVLIPMKEAELYGMTMKRKIGEGKNVMKQFATGDLLVSLRYSDSQKQIQGVILKASNLPRPHRFGLADPYVKVYLIHKGKRQAKWKTSIKRNTLLPVFNEPFQFDVVDMNLKNVHLEFLVMDHDRFRRNDIIGVVYIGPNCPQECGRSQWSEMMTTPRHSISRWHPLLPRHEAKTVHKHLDSRALRRMKSRSL